MPNVATVAKSDRSSPSRDRIRMRGVTIWLAAVSPAGQRLCLSITSQVIDSTTLPWNDATVLLEAEATEDAS
jgi:hypothetical protein